MKFDNLRPPQKKAVDLLRKDWKLYNRHVLYASVAFGKTAFASYLADQFKSKGMRVLFIAPYTVLVEQTAEKFIEYGFEPTDIGIIWRDHPWFNPQRPIQIASADTLIRRDWPDNIDLVIVDECHIRRKALIEIFKEINTPVIGLSGTPFASWMGSVYDNLIKPCTMRELIDQGYLSDYEFYAPTKPDMTGAKTSNLSAFGQDYKDKDAHAAMDKPQVYGDIVSFWLENGDNRQTIAFCVNVAHAKQMTLEFNRAGIPAEVITAKTPQNERKEIFKRYDEGVTKILCNVGVLVAGFDADVRCVIYARPTKSEIRWIQCLGRGLRTADGKDKCLIFDHSGSVFNLGFPDQIEYDSLINKDDGLNETRSTREEIEKLEKLPTECPSCHYIKPAGSPPKCPRCGFMPISGEDVPTDRKVRLQKLKSKLDGDKPATMQEKQAFYSELKGYQREMRARGKVIKDGWCDHKYREKFGVWPKNINKTQIKEISVSTRNWIKAQQIRWAKSRKSK